MRKKTKKKVSKKTKRKVSKKTKRKVLKKNIKVEGNEKELIFKTKPEWVKNAFSKQTLNIKINIQITIKNNNEFWKKRRKKNNLD